MSWIFFLEGNRRGLPRAGVGRGGRGQGDASVRQHLEPAVHGQSHEGDAAKVPAITRDASGREQRL